MFKKILNRTLAFCFFVASAFLLIACNNQTKYNINIVQATGGQISASVQQAKAGEVVYLNHDADNDYVFKHFTLNQEQLVGNSFVMPEEEVTVSAVFELDGFAINISNQTGGTIFANRLAAKQGETITLGVFTNSGYEFKHFLLNGSQISGNSFVMQEEVTVSAVFELITYTITYNYFDATIEGQLPETYDVEDEFTLPTPVKAHYDFVGWYTNENLSGSPITKIDFGTTGSLNLYAKLTPTNYAITYNLNGGENSPNNPTTHNIESEKITLEPATRVGYHFVGWYLNSNFSNGSNITYISAHTTDNITLFAKFEAIFTISHLGEITGLTTYAKSNVFEIEIAEQIDGVNIVSIAKDALSNTNITKVTINKNILEVHGFSSCNYLETVILNEGTKIIGESAFAGCKQLKNISLPNSVQVISESAFYYCTSLSSLHLSKNISQIGSQAFYSCSNNLIITVDSNHTKYRIENNCLIDITANAVIYGMASQTVTIPSSVTRVAEYAFAGASIENLIISEGVLKLDHASFFRIKNINTITFPSTLQAIGSMAFYEVFKSHNPSDLVIYIPSSVTTIYQLAFTKPCTIIFESEIPGENIFSEFDENANNEHVAVIYVPDDSVESYKQKLDRTDILPVSSFEA